MGGKIRETTLTREIIDAAVQKAMAQCGVANELFMGTDKVWTDFFINIQYEEYKKLVERIVKSGN